MNYMHHGHHHPNLSTMCLITHISDTHNRIGTILCIAHRERQTVMYMVSVQEMAEVTDHDCSSGSAMLPTSPALTNVGTLGLLTYLHRIHFVCVHLVEKCLYMCKFISAPAWYTKDAPWLCKEVTSWFSSKSEDLWHQSCRQAYYRCHLLVCCSSSTNLSWKNNVLYMYILLDVI